MTGFSGVLAAGDLDRRIELRRQMSGSDAVGQPNAGWITIDTVWAWFKPAFGKEIMNGLAADAVMPSTFRIRWRRDVDPSWVIRFDGLLYDIYSITEIGRREGLEILATAQVRPA